MQSESEAREKPRTEAEQKKTPRRGLDNDK